MKKFNIALAFLLVIGLTACSSDDSFVEKNQSINQKEQKKELMAFEDSYNEWIATRAKMSKIGKDKEIPATNNLIVSRAYNFLLAYGHNKKQLKKEMKTNEKFLIAKAIKLYINEK